MKIIKGNIWDYYYSKLNPNNWLVITTNTQIKNGGNAVLGRGIALEANDRFPGLAADYGYFLQKHQENSVPFCQRHLG